MPSRRSHVNSHHGCSQCKTRRIKCDETYPICRKCMKRGIQCSNEDISINRSSQSRSTSPKKNSCSPMDFLDFSASFAGLNLPLLHPSLSSNESLVNSSPSSRSLIQLMHHYTLHTAPTFCDYPFLLPLWQSVVPSLALANPFLLHSIAALSSMHLAHLSPPTESHIHIQAALSHQDAAFALIRPTINDINKQNASALLVTSFFVPIFDFASRTRPASSPVSTSTSTFPLLTDLSRHSTSTQYENFISTGPHNIPQSTVQQSTTTLTIPRQDVLSQLQTIFNLFRGILAIVDITSDWVRTGPLASLLSQHFPDDAPPATPDVEAALDRLDAFSDSFAQSHSFPTLDSHPQPQPQPQGILKQVADPSSPPCKRAISLLRTAFRTAHTMPGRFSAIFKWAVVVDDGFLAAVRREEEPALCVLGLYGVLFHGLDGFWWTRGWGRALVGAVEDRVGMPEGRELLGWARGKIDGGWEGEGLESG